MDSVNKFEPVLIWPSCSKNDFTGTKKFIADISAALYARHGTHFINICTDGDSTRRQVMHNIMQHEIPFFCSIYSYVKDFPFVDTKLGKNLEAVNFDAIHLAKRCWYTMLKDKVELYYTNN